MRLLLHLQIERKYFVIFAILFYSFTTAQNHSYNNPDALKEKRVQFRRGEAIDKFSQSYDEKYQDKDLQEIKKSLFPNGRISSETGIWKELSPGIPRITYMGLHFIDQNTGWMAGEFGAIIKTTDSGLSWITEETNISSVLTNLHSYDGNTVLTCGYSGVILRSTDGGENWSQVQSGISGDLWGIQMINENLGWACGTSNSLIRTTDGGLSWESKSTGITANYWQLEFLNEQYGFIACSGGIVLKTTDGGNNWQSKQAGSIYSLFSIDIIDSLHLAASGNQGKNIYSSDGGESWIENNRLQYDETNCIRFVSADTGYTLGIYEGENWGIRKTTNRGAVWFTPERGNLSDWDMQFIPGGIGFSTGSMLQLNKTMNGYDNWDNMVFPWDIAGISFTDEMTGYIAAQNMGGTIFKTTDGGHKWFSLPGFIWTFLGVESVKFIDSLTGFAGVDARILKTTDAGNTWYQVNFDDSGSKKQFLFINPQTGWAISNKVFKTTNGGESWFPQLNNSGYIIFQNLCFMDSSTGWLAALATRPFKTTDGGSSWIVQSNLTFYQTKDIFFSSLQKGFLIESNKLYKTFNDGLDWNIILNSQWLLRGFGALLSNHIFTIGDGIFETIDSGDTWNEIVPLRNIGFRKFSSLNGRIGYAAGKLGLIYKYTDTTATPVELTSFSGNYHNNSIILNWTTVTELNNSGFEILRSNDKVNWQTTGYIQGNGTSTYIHNYEFIDNPKYPGDYFYRLKQIDYNGGIQFSNIIEVKVTGKVSYELLQNYPNPFNPTTIISFTVPHTTEVNIILYDITGQKIKTLYNGKADEGFHSIIVDAKGFCAGVYFYRMTTNSGFTAVKKTTLIK